LWGSQSCLPVWLKLVFYEVVRASPDFGRGTKRDGGPVAWLLRVKLRGDYERGRPQSSLRRFCERLRAPVAVPEAILWRIETL
jgi:hypothetical protein